MELQKLQTEEKRKKLNNMIIEIEAMAFGDYRVQVWGDDLESALDREYFCRGYDSAFLTALNIRNLDGFENLKIQLRVLDKIEKLKI